MVDIKSEFQSGQFTLYGQCTDHPWYRVLPFCRRFLDIIFVISTSVLSYKILIVFSIFSGIILLLEIPLFVKVIPGGPKIQTFVDYFENHYFRGALYLAFSIVIFLSTLQANTSLILPGITLLATSACYFVAGFKHQERVTSSLLGGTGIMAGAQSLA
ncbi:hypothetical protein K502DRAFT_352118 [Neoconidiobolus thromboides FSU 785]|nr:hypothetical protein K502DRAFT_352118 [Neoconidiobolus thromboides FSU 785]